MPNLRWPAILLAVILSVIIAVVSVITLTIALIWPRLPGMQALTDYQPKLPMRVYTADGTLLAEFGEQRRAVITLAQTPKVLQEAILAAEDERFYQHGGIDLMGVLRAAATDLAHGGAHEGASTITMQVARNFFLTRAKTISRKINEALLSIKIERNLSKEQILTLYINQIYLGQRAYGFAAAAQAYFGKPVNKLSIAECAMLAGLPKAPSRYNPVVNPARASARQHYVLGRMLALHYITQAEYDHAMHEKLNVRHGTSEHYAVQADYVAEMIRQAMYAQYHDAIYTNGLRVYTTLHKRDQEAADRALWQGVEDYDRRHGYRGPEAWIKLPDAIDQPDALDDALEDFTPVHDLLPALVLSAGHSHLHVWIQNTGFADLAGNALKFVARALKEKDGNPAALRAGAVIRLQKAPDGSWQIAQLPKAQAALVALDPDTGAIRALVGGFDYDLDKYNHVTQALRQPGSSFKPFIYSAALTRGVTPATLLSDSPISISAEQTGSVAWNPKDYEDTWNGSMVSMRNALVHSLNLPTIRILQTITPAYAQEYVKRFGFEPDHVPPYLTMALGAGSATPLQMASAYAIFANGGAQVRPWIIDHIEDQAGHVLMRSTPPPGRLVLDPRNAFIITNLMQDVTRRGTAAAAAKLGRTDIAGKTGTTNDQVDAWFAGFQRHRVAIAWIGFDQPHSLGGGETGARAALPIWMGYMGEVLKELPESPFTPPDGVVTENINPQTGLPPAPGDTGVPEYFLKEFVPGVAGSQAIITVGEPAGAPATQTSAPASASPAQPVSNFFLH